MTPRSVPSISTTVDQMLKAFLRGRTRLAEDYFPEAMEVDGFEVGADLQSDGCRFCDHVMAGHPSGPTCRQQQRGPHSDY